MQCIIAVSLQLIRPAIFNTNLFGEKMLFYTYQQNIFLCVAFFFFTISSHTELNFLLDVDYICS